MIEINKLKDDEYFNTFVGNGLNICKEPVSSRLGIPGLSMLVREKSGADLRLDEVYMFGSTDNKVLTAL